MFKVLESDFMSLKGNEQFGGLYEHLVYASRDGSGTVIASADGTILVRESRLRESFRKMFAAWLRTPNVAVIPLPNEELAVLQKEQREAEAEKAKVIEDAANARAAWYVREQGMLDNTYNRDLFLGWFETNKAAYTAHNVDLAVEQLASQIQWAVWSPRVQPVSEVRMIEGTNESELPIDATESQMRRATKVQLEDLSKRRGEFQQSRRGSFGASFIKATF